MTDGKQTRFVSVEVTGDGETPRQLDGQVKAKQVSRLHQHVVVGKKSRDLATAKILLTRGVSVLLLGAEALSLFRPDLKLSKVRGVPFMVAPWREDSPVALATWHPNGIKAKPLRDGFEEDVAQWVWRGVKDRQGRWPEVCVKCQAPLDHYDVTGVAWCDGDYPGAEPPRHVANLTLDLEVA